MFSKFVACGEFVKRQTAESGYSHFDGTWEELEKLVEAVSIEETCHGVGRTGSTRNGYKDGVVLVDLHPKNFYSAIVSLDENTKLVSNYAPRRPGEAAFIRTSAKAKKQPAKYVSVVLYRHDVLDENNERETDAKWEIVCIKARVTEEEEPMDPYTMARNFLHLKGGTKGDFSAEDFAKSIVYWNNHCMSVGKPKWYKKIINFMRSVKADIIKSGHSMWGHLF